MGFIVSKLTCQACGAEITTDRQYAKHNDDCKNRQFGVIL